MDEIKIDGSGIENEQQVISLLLNDRECVKYWIHSRITPNFFVPQHRDILSGILHAHNNDTALTKKTYQNFLANYKKLIPKEHASQMSLYEQCYMRAVKKDDLPMMLDKVKKAYIRAKSNEHLKEYTKEREKLGDIGANKSLSKKLASLEANVTEHEVQAIELHTAKDKFMRDLEERSKNPLARLICNIPEIDETMSVGFKEGHLTLFCAEVGNFKTTMLVNVALNIFKQANENVNVLFIPLEMDPEEILNKIVSRETRIPLDMLEHAERLSSQQKVQIAEELDRWTSVSNKFQILALKGRSKVSTIRNEIEKQMEYFKPRIVVVDYADKLAPEEKQARTDIEMQFILDDLRKMGKELGFAIISAAQLGRDALKKLREAKEGKQQLGSADIRGGQVMAAESDTVYAQMRNPADPGGELLFFCIKSRHGKNTFGNNRDRVTLKITPNIGLIESANSLGWNGKPTDPLIDGLNVPPPVEEEVY